MQLNQFSTYMFLLYWPPTLNKASVICPNEQNLVASINLSNKFSNYIVFKKISNYFENKPVKIYANEIINKENRVLKIKKTSKSKEITGDIIINISKEEWNNSLKELFDNFENDNIWKREFINLIHKENLIINSVF